VMASDPQHPVATGLSRPLPTAMPETSPFPGPALIDGVPASGSAGVSLTPGARPLPEYELVRLLGRGGFGEVWLATGPGGFEVALKFIQREGHAGATELRALEVMKKIHHPNLLGMFGTWERPPYLIVALELADGSLWDYFEEA